MEAARMQLKRTLLGTNEAIFLEPPTGTDAGFVNAWICSATQATAQGIGSRVWVPEGFLREPSDDGARLIQCTDGYEGQIWHHGHLVSSRWWAEAPDTADWIQFIEGTDAATGLPTIPDFDWKSLPPVTTAEWRKDLSLLSLGRDSIQKVFSPVRSGLLVFVLLLLPFGFLLGTKTKLQTYIKTASTEISALGERNEAISNAQNKALLARRHAEAVYAAGTSMALLDLLNDLETSIGKADARISFMSYSRDSIEIHLRGLSGDQIPDLVSKLETTENWSDASASSNRTGEIVVKGRLSSGKDTRR